MTNLFKMLLVFILCTAAHGQEAISIYHDGQSASARQLENIFTDQYNIPKELINTVQIKDPCKIKKKLALVHLCLNKKSELKIVYADKEFIKNSLTIFYEEETSEALL